MPKLEPNAAMVAVVIVTVAVPTATVTTTTTSLDVTSLQIGVKSLTDATMRRVSSTSGKSTTSIRTSACSHANSIGSLNAHMDGLTQTLAMWSKTG